MTYASVERLKALAPHEYTWGATLGPAMQMTDPDEARAYFDALVDEQCTRYEWDREGAYWLVRQNLGYYAGYYDQATASRVFELFHVEHPLFGTTFPTMDEALELGKEWGRKMASGET